MKNNIKFWNFVLIALVGGFIGLQELYVKRYVAFVFAVLFGWTCIPAIVALIEALVWLFRGEEEFDKNFNRYDDRYTLLD